MDSTSFCEKKYLVTNTIQELYDEHTRSLEVFNQYKCECELDKKSLILTIKKQEEEIKNRDNTINRLEDENSKKNKQISEYEKMIRDLEDKMNELLIEKEEENRFDIIRLQNKSIEEKENEIIRLTNLLKKKEDKKTDKTDKKIINVLDSLASNVKEETIEVEEVSDNRNPDEEDCSIEVTVVKTNLSTKKATEPDEDELIYGENAGDIAADRMAAHISDKINEDYKEKENKIEAEYAKAIENYETFHEMKKGTATLENLIDSSAGIKGWLNYNKEDDIYKIEPTEEVKSESENSQGESEGEEEEEEDYECLTYRGKQYWIIVGEDPQYVYEIVGEDKDEVGDKLGVYKKTAGGKMKVFLDKK